MLKLSFRLYRNLGNREVEAPDSFDGITLYEGDLLSYHIDQTLFSLRLHQGSFCPVGETPNVLYELAELSLSLGKIEALTTMSQPCVWTVRPFMPVSHVGLCPCGLSALKSLSPGDLIQNWCGEIFQYTLEGGVRHVTDGWTPGKDLVAKQKSRYWEN